jgi:hypothetical protein
LNKDEAYLRGEKIAQKYKIKLEESMWYKYVQLVKK